MTILIIFAFGFIIGGIFFQSLKRGSLAPIIISTIVGLLVGIVFASVRIVPAGYVGVVDLFGKVSGMVLPSGINFVNPLAKVIKMSVKTQGETEQMSVPSKEGMNVGLDVSVVYKLDPSKAAEIYKTVGYNYQEVVLVPQFRSVARDVTVGYEAKALYTSEREILTQKFQEYLTNSVKDRGIIVEKVLLRSIVLPQILSGAIEQKLKAEQEAERMKFILQKEQQEAERKRVEATGIRDAQAIINQSLTSQYLHYLWINTLNLNPNVIYVATEANMPLFRTVDDDFKLIHKKPGINPEQQK